MNIPVTETSEYKQLTKILEILEQQREQVLKDKEIIQNAYEEALKSPIDYIENLVGGKINLPGKINIAVIPNLTIGLSTFNNNNNNNTRYRTPILSSESESESDNNGRTNKLSRRKLPQQSLLSSINTETNLSSISESETNQNAVGGSGGGSYRYRKPTGENLAYWTEAEQKLLEQLLIKYPEEEVASHRWTKIASHIKGRTPQQVASRTQKFFKKLEKAGLRPPGARNKKQQQQQQQSQQQQQQSTNKQPQSQSRNDFSSDNENLKNKISIVNSKSKVVHTGFKCDGCDIEPIVGTRWHCEECINELDLCEDCKEKYEEIGSHNSSHHMSAIDNPDNYFMDDDYKYSYPTGESNYLDTNYR
ncbi:hypothetical protein ACTA71_012040 [Dictyostelium dimigraforme]